MDLQFKYTTRGVMRAGIFTIIDIVAMLMFYHGVLLAQESIPQSTEAHWYDAVTVNGFVSSAYSFNLNKPEERTNRFHIFDINDNSFTLDVIELSVKKDAITAGDAGFHCDLTAGSAIPHVARSSGMNIGDLDFHQMYLSYVAPVGNGIKLDIGKFITPLGYEVIEGYDGYNDNYSRSFLFGYAIPFTHTGIRAGYIFSESISALLMIVNGWDNAIDSNKSKTIGAQIGITPVNGMNIYANYMIGPEKMNNNSDNRSVVDFVAMYTPVKEITFGFNADYGREQHTTIDNCTAVWFGVAGYGKYRVSNNISLAIRAEQFNDEYGVRTGVIQRLQEITFSPEYTPSENIIVRADWRYDKSDKTVFQKRNNPVDSQTVLAFNFIYLF
jgi:hypothetical protein